MSQAYAITYTKIMPGEVTGQISDLLEDWGFKSAEDAVREFKKEAPNKRIYSKRTLDKRHRYKS